MSSNGFSGKIATKDAEFMYRVVQHMEGKPNVNWDGVAATLGYKSGSVASTRFNQIKRKMEAPTTGPGSTSSGSGVNNTNSAKTPAKPKPSKVTKVQAGKTRTRRKAPVAAQLPKEDGKEGGKDSDNEEAKSGLTEEATREVIKYATPAAVACVAENNNTKDDDSVTDFDMVENEYSQNCNSEPKFEDFDADEDEYLMVMDADDEGDADDEQ